MIKNKKIGLALGSGGARGLAHIGVLKILEENNIKIDYIAGSSIGALIGGFYASGMKAKEIETIVLKTNWSNLFSFIDLNLKNGLIGGKKIKKFIEKSIGNLNFENLKIPLTVVATDFKNGEVVYFNQGDVDSAIRASISLPLVFKPAENQGRFLGDGGLSMPVPVEAVKKMGADIVLAVNLDGSYFNNDKIKSPFGLYQIANNSINIVRYHLANLNVKNADLVICPLVGSIGWDKFINGQDIILAGEKAIKEKIKELKKIIA